MLKVFTVTLKVCGPENSRESDLKAYLENLIKESDIPAERDIFSIEDILAVDEDGMQRLVDAEFTPEID